MKNTFLLSVIAIFLAVIISFSCRKKDGEQMPAITSFSPESGKVGDVITIQGKNFSPTVSGNVVKFNSITAEVMEASATIIKVKVPASATTGKILVTTGGRTATSTKDFVIHQSPMITSVDPGHGKPGEIVTITGVNFSATASGNEVKFNTTVATEFISVSTSELKIKIPAGATTGKISVKVNGMVTLSNSDFIVSPEITKISPEEGLVNSTVVIEGRNFSNIAANNIIRFNGTVAVVSEATATKITTKVPAGATTGKITVAVDGITAESEKSFQVRKLTVYVAGTDYNQAGGVYRAVYWRNNIRYNLPDYNLGSEAYKVVLDNNGNFFIAGYVVTPGGYNVACYWKNGSERIELEPATKNSMALGIYVSNTDIYCSGYFTQTAPDIKGCYWKNGVRTAYDAVVNNYDFGSGIYVEGSRVYVTDGKKGYWDAGNYVALSSSTGAGTFAITKYGNDLLVAGMENGACYWKNGTKHVLPVNAGPEPSAATAIVAKEGKYYFTGVDNNLKKGIYWSGNPVTALQVSPDGTSFAYCRSLSIFSETAYMCGSARVSGFNDKPFIYADGAYTWLPVSGPQGHAYSVVVTAE